MSDSTGVDPLSGRGQTDGLEPDRQSHPERICPNCGAELIERSCKLLCPNRQCGYAMSCSDFY